MVSIDQDGQNQLHGENNICCYDDVLGEDPTQQQQQQQSIIAGSIRGSAEESKVELDDGQDIPPFVDHPVSFASSTVLLGSTTSSRSSTQCTRSTTPITTAAVSTTTAASASAENYNTATSSCSPVVDSGAAATTTSSGDEDSNALLPRPSHALAKVVVASPLTSAVVAPTTTTTQHGPDFKDQMRIGRPIGKSTNHSSPPAGVENKLKAKLKLFVPTKATTRGPEFKDQSRRVDDPVERDRIPNGPVPPLEPWAENDHEIITGSNSTTAIEERSPTTDWNRGRGSVSSAPHLVEAELVNNLNNDHIGVAAEVMEEKPRRKAWIGVMVLVLALVVISGIIRGVQEADSGATETGPSTQNLESLKNSSGCYNATALELDDTPIDVFFDDRNKSVLLADYAIVPICGSTEGLSDDLTI